MIILVYFKAKQIKKSKNTKQVLRDCMQTNSYANYVNKKCDFLQGILRMGAYIMIIDPNLNVSHGQFD